MTKDESTAVVPRVRTLYLGMAAVGDDGGPVLPVTDSYRFGPHLEWTDRSLSLVIGRRLSGILDSIEDDPDRFYPPRKDDWQVDCLYQSALEGWRIDKPLRRRIGFRSVIHCPHLLRNEIPRLAGETAAWLIEAVGTNRLSW